MKKIDEQAAISTIKTAKIARLKSNIQKYKINFFTFLGIDLLAISALCFLGVPSLSSHAHSIEESFAIAMLTTAMVSTIIASTFFIHWIICKWEIER